MKRNILFIVFFILLISFFIPAAANAAPVKVAEDEKDKQGDDNCDQPEDKISSRNGKKFHPTADKEQKSSSGKADRPAAKEMDSKFRNMQVLPYAYHLKNDCNVSYTYANGRVRRISRK